MSFRCLSWLDSRSSSPGSSRGQSHCVLFRVGQGTLLSHYLLSTCKLQGNQGLHAMPLHPGRLAILALRKTGVNCQQFCVTMIAQTYLFFLILILRVGKKKRIIVNVRFFMLSVLPTGYIGVIRGIFVGSAFLWITGSLVSKTKLKLQ